MNKSRWKKLNKILAAAVEMETARRDSFLDGACHGDADLRREAEEMLSAVHQAKADDFLLQDAFSLGANILAAGETIEGRRLGNYEIIREIGRGGMGRVFLAERADFRQQAAVKIIKRGMDTDEIIRRFARERDVLASLNHSSIARLIDGGVSRDGLPYIVMEYVEGENITEFCDQRRLTIEDRLALFQKVCSAVAYAHQNLVVHRDIKPSNILIKPDGEPKLLDFGIAKLLAADSFGDTIEETATGALLMTPEYASPEQIRGERITTASDIYSLGVLLYELLCGHRPFRFKNFPAGEVRQIISEQQPPAPSTAALATGKIARREGDTGKILSPETVAEKRSEKPARLQRKLTGDLDNIVLMSLRKEPQRRYDSVQQFAEDVRRHLEGLPVVARPATVSYRASKFIRRNRTATLFAAVALLAILAGFTIAVWQTVVARQERARAERRFTDVRNLANSVVYDLHDAIETLPGSTSARELLVKSALEYLDRLAQESGDDAELQNDLAAAYEKIGTVQGNPYAANLGDAAGAQASYLKALAIREKLTASPSAIARDRFDLGRTYSTLADLLWSQGDNDEALNFYRKALAINQGLAGAEPANTEFLIAVARNYYSIGQVSVKKGDFRGALEDYRKSLSLYQTAETAVPQNLWIQGSIAIGWLKIGDLLRIMDNDAEALENHQRAFQYFEKQLADSPNNAEAKRNAAFALDRVAIDLMDSGKLVEALKNEERVLLLQKDLAAQDAKNVQIRADIAATYSTLGHILTALDRPDTARDNLQKSIDMFQDLLRANPDYVENRSELALASLRLGGVLLKKGQSKAALENLQSALQVLEAEPARTEMPWELAVLYELLGDAQTDKAETKSFYEKSRELWKDLERRNFRANFATRKIEQLTGKINLP